MALKKQQQSFRADDSSDESDDSVNYDDSD